MSSNKVTKVNRVTKHRRPHRLSDRHRKVNTESVISISQSKTNSKSLEIPNRQTHDYDNNIRSSKQNSYTDNEIRSSSFTQSYLDNKNLNQPSEISQTSVKLSGTNLSETHQDFRHLQSVTSNRKSDVFHENSMISPTNKNLEESLNKQQRPKHYLTRNKPSKIIDNKKEIYSETLKKNTKNDMNRHLKRICCKCSPCCCLASTIGLILLIAGFGALIASLTLLSKKTTTSDSILTITTTTTSTVTSTTATTTTTTSTTSITTSTSSTSSTTTSDTTSTTTSSTSSTATSSTSSTTTSSTSSTATSSTTSTATSSTSTSSTTSTTSTSTTSTSAPATTTSIKVTTTTTKAPPCPPTSVGTASVLWTTNSPTTTSYACQAYSWTASTTGTVWLRFQMQHRPGRWYLDDVSVFHGGTQLLDNGGFEDGVFLPWVRTTPNGGSCGGQYGDITSSSSNGGPKAGTYYLWDGQMNCYDQIQQAFDVIAGETYVVSYWLKSTSNSGSDIFAKVFIS